MNPRKYNDQEAIRAELHQASLHIISVMAPYLRGRSRQLFDDLASGKLQKREFADFLPPRDDAAQKTETPKDSR
jgi:hypothetical protein